MDILGFSFLIIYFLIHLKLIISGDFKYRIVQYCPHDDIDISKNDEECVSQNKEIYYCLKTENHTLVEFCGPVYYFSGKGGCPVYHGRGDIKFETCVPDEECPPQDSEDVVITSFYKYKTCFRVNDENHTQKTHNLLTTKNDTATLDKSIQRTTEAEEYTNSTFPASNAVSIQDSPFLLYSEIIIAVIVIFALVIANIIIITIVLRRIKQNDRRLNETMCQAEQRSHNEAWNDIYDFVDENQID